jgi:hypothetical protein
MLRRSDGRRSEVTMTNQSFTSLEAADALVLLRVFDDSISS